MAVSATIIPGPALAASFFPVETGLTEFLPDLGFIYSGEDASQQETILSHKLVTRIELPLRGNCQVIKAGPTPKQPFRQARPFFQINIKVKELKRIALFIGLPPKVGKPVILCKNLLKIIGSNGIGSFGSQVTGSTEIFDPR